MNSFVSADAFEAAVEASPAHKATLNHRRRKVAEYRLQQHNGHNGVNWGTAETVSCVPVVAVPCMGWLIVFLLTQCLLLKWRKRKGFYPKASRYAARCYKVYIRRKCALDRKVIRLYLWYIVLRYILDIKVLRAKERCKKKLTSIFDRCKLICVNVTVSIYRHIPPMRVSAAVIFLGLLMSGNVELNPGPEQEKLLKLCKDGCTADVGVFKSLLDQGVDPNIHDDEYGCHPLWYASRYGKRDLVELFLQYKADVNLKANDDYTALHIASFNGHTNVVHVLITRGATVDIISKDGFTPLYLASQNGHKGVVKLLLDKANVDLQNKDGYTALRTASFNGHTDVVRLLITRGATVDIISKDGFTPLYVASQEGHKGVVKLLLDKANVDLQNKDGGTPLYMASQEGHKGVVELLLDKGANVDHQNKDGFTPLYVASQKGHKGVVELLLDKGANVDQQNKEGFTPLYLASQEGHEGVVELLLEKGANVDQQNKNGTTPLYIASQEGHKGVVELLIDKGANVNQQKKDGYTALHIASSKGHTDVVRLLITRGATVDIKVNKDGRTALHRASSSGHTDVVKLLVDSGAQIDIKDKDGQTALHLASNSGHTDVVKLLVDSAAQIDNKNDVDPATFESDDTSSETLPKKDEARPKSPVPSGHILLKHELEALAKLLAAYSDERLKDIKINIQKKQGGDISREEVERSLREKGLTSIADDLKENLEKSVEDQQHYEAYESALKVGIPLTMQYLKFLFFGPPRTGKSTARRRLVQEIVNLKSLGKPSASTGVAEANDVIIKKLTSEPAAISGSQWWSVKKSKEDGQIDEGDCDYLAQLFYRLISKTMSETEQTTTVPATVSEPASSIIERESEESVIAESTDIKEASSPPKSPMLQNHTGQDLLAESRAEMSSVPLSNSEEKQIDEAFKKLTSTLQSGSPEELRKLLQNLTMLNMVDIGGQSAFLELCPAFTTGPALYFIFFRLDQELKKNYQIKYQSADGEETILESSYCTETVVHQTLSSIACFEKQSTAESAKSAPSSIVSGRAILVGTYKDKVNDERISQMNTALRQQLEHTKLYKEDLLLQASEDTLFYSLNNMTGDDSEMSPIRKDIEKIIKSKFSEVVIPASWLMFRIILHFLHKPVVSVNECEEIARRLSMNTRVREAIWFFHNNIGSLMHYPDIPSMKDMVICDSQVIFDSTSELIIDTFKVSNRDIPQSAVKDFREKGQFSLEHIKDRTENHRNNQLSLEQLVDLLKSHNILAEIKSDQQSSKQLKPSQESSAQDKQYQPKFVMPAVLKEASEEELKLENAKPEAAPLMIHFEGGFVPFGVFCASVANLIAHQDSLSPSWQLCDGQVMKNKVKFCIDKSFYATLISRPQYFEIRVERHPRARAKLSLPNICSTVRQTVVQTLETVITKMRYNVHAKIETAMFPTAHSFNVAFTCCMEVSHSDHLMKVNKDESEYFGECLEESIRLDLGKRHLIWFNQDNCSSNVVQLDASPSTSSASGAKIESECADQSDGKTRKIVKSGQITNPDRLFNDLSKDIGVKYSDIGYELGLTFKVMENELETGKYETKPAPMKAMKMLHLWKENVTEEEFTYAVLAAALEKKGLKRYAEQYCYTTDVSK